MRQRPKTAQHYVHQDDIPPLVRAAVVCDFAEPGLDRIFREMNTQRRTLAHHVMCRQERQATYREDGTRVERPPT